MANIASYSTHQLPDGIQYRITATKLPFPWWLIIFGLLLCCTLLLAIFGIAMMVAAVAAYFVQEHKIGGLFVDSSFVVSHDAIKLPPEFKKAWGENASLKLLDIDQLVVRNNFGGVDLASCRRSSGLNDRFNRAWDATGNATEMGVALITNLKLRKVGWRLDADAQGKQFPLALSLDEKTAHQLLEQLDAQISKNLASLQNIDRT